MRKELINHIRYSLEIGADVFLTENEAKEVITALEQQEQRCEMTKDQKEKILKALVEDRNNYTKDCNMRIAKENGRIDGADFMLHRIIDILHADNAESEE